MSSAYLSYISSDLLRQMYRNGVTGGIPIRHPQKTLYAMRVLAGIDDQYTRINLSKAYFKVIFTSLL